MDDYRQKAHQRYLEKMQIKIEEDNIQKEELRKKQEEEDRKQIYIQEQILIINEAISTYQTDKTDDNIMMILTIIKGCIDNLEKIKTTQEMNNIRDLVIAFSNEVDAHNTVRPKGVDTIANVKILKESFEQIFNLLDLEVEIQTLDTTKDEEIAKQLAETLNNPPPTPPPTPREPLEEGFEEIKEEDAIPHNDGYIEDEEYARRLQEEINKPHVKTKKQTLPKLSSKYVGLSCDDFIKELMKEKTSNLTK